MKLFTALAVTADDLWRHLCDHSGRWIHLSLTAVQGDGEAFPTRPYLLSLRSILGLLPLLRAGDHSETCHRVIGLSRRFCRGVQGLATVPVWLFPASEQSPSPTNITGRVPSNRSSEEWIWRNPVKFLLVCQSLYSPSTDVVVFQSPVYLVLTLTVPVVDYENYKNNWCRWLNVIHCVTVPLFLMTISHSTYSFIVVLVGQYGTKGDVAALTWMLGPVPLGAVIGAASLALAIAVYATSKHDAAPRYHALFGYMGFATSVGWIYCIANEIVAVIKTVGVVFKLSDAILGLTVLAWGNSVGDFISNLSVARQGYPRMGISACYGGPLLSILWNLHIHNLNYKASCLYTLVKEYM
ncbi:SLC8B1 [Cordylochernes scorpioides]|uniref:SLC8B1 n=1 Tax=Cordylochernes scorpioides TaxID=51811 RepID=A0ABY6KT44_9ARAC|nr:SLC8B1 [Cordylochernes scorpioides]